MPTPQPATSTTPPEPHAEDRPPSALETAIEVGFVLLAVTVGILLSV